MIDFVISITEYKICQVFVITVLSVCLGDPRCGWKGSIQKDDNYFYQFM